MNIKIFYNDEIDEFSNDSSLESRIKRYVAKNFYPACIISTLAPIYLVGGSIRDLMYARKPKDLDLVVVGKEHTDWVLKVLVKFNIQYELNRFGGYKFIYHETKIDLWCTDDLFSAMQYNVDGLFFEIKTSRLISFTFDDFRQNGIKLVNSENNIEKSRELKLAKFEKKYNSGK